MKAAIGLKHNVCLRGASGTGKTFLVKELAREAGAKLYCLNMTTNATVDEVKGKLILKPKEGNGLIPVWVDGSLTRAMREGAWVVIEEANFMAPELSSVFYSVMDDRRELILDEKDGEVVHAAEGFRLFFTCNWDYVGTQRFNDAIANRVNSWFDLKYLSNDLEAALIVDRVGIDKKVASNIALATAGIRSIQKESNYPDVSTRILLNWAAMVKAGLTPMQAAEHSIIPLLAYSDDDKSMVRDHLKAVFEPRARDEDE